MSTPKTTKKTKAKNKKSIPVIELDNTEEEANDISEINPEDLPFFERQQYESMQGRMVKKRYLFRPERENLRKLQKEKSFSIGGDSYELPEGLKTPQSSGKYTKQQNLSKNVDDRQIRFMPREEYGNDSLDESFQYFSTPRKNIRSILKNSPTRIIARNRNFQLESNFIKKYFIIFGLFFVLVVVTLIVYFTNSTNKNEDLDFIYSSLKEIKLYLKEQNDTWMENFKLFRESVDSL